MKHIPPKADPEAHSRHTRGIGLAQLSPTDCGLPCAQARGCWRMMTSRGCACPPAAPARRRRSPPARRWARCPRSRRRGRAPAARPAVPQRTRRLPPRALRHRQGSQRTRPRVRLGSSDAPRRRQNGARKARWRQGRVPVKGVCAAQTNNRWPLLRPPRPRPAARGYRTLHRSRPANQCSRRAHRTCARARRAALPARARHRAAAPQWRGRPARPPRRAARTLGRCGRVRRLRRRPQRPPRRARPRARRRRRRARARRPCARAWRCSCRRAGP